MLEYYLIKKQKERNNMTVSNASLTYKALGFTFCPSPGDALRKHVENLFGANRPETIPSDSEAVSKGLALGEVKNQGSGPYTDASNLTSYGALLKEIELAKNWGNFNRGFFTFFLLTSLALVILTGLIIHSGCFPILFITLLPLAVTATCASVSIWNVYSKVKTLLEEAQKICAQEPLLMLAEPNQESEVKK